MLKDLIIISILYFSFLYLARNNFDCELIIFLLVPYFLMFFLPTVFLHYNYLLNENNRSVFEIEKDKIVKKSGEAIVRYLSKDITQILFYEGGTRNNGYAGLAHSKYCFAKINFNDGTFFIINSLYSDKVDKILEENFKDVKITKEKVFYPMI